MELPSIMNTEKKKDEKVEALTDAEKIETEKDEKIKWDGDNYIDLQRMKELHQKLLKETYKTEEDYRFEDFLR